MLQLLVSSPEYETDNLTQLVWKWVSEHFHDEDGVAYYQHPVVKTVTGIMADLTILTRQHHPLTIKCFPYQLSEIEEVNEDIWRINDQQQESPLLELDDFNVILQGKIDRQRRLRGLLSPKAVLALPLISQSEFEQKFGSVLDDTLTIWAGGDTRLLSAPLEALLDDIQWRIARAVFQGVAPLTISAGATAQQATTLGETIRELDKAIALLDEDQEKGAIQIAPGPQRIRGLAGTGKTVLLAMKAANIHLRFPDSMILFTFNTQSLYNQAKSLISKFYRYHSDFDPDWEKLHVRHAWGGRSRPGVYSDLSSRQGLDPLTFESATTINPQVPFQACCERALSQPIRPEYDFILVDEAQDFPPAFFRVLFALSKPPHQISWAYDELQSLSLLEIPQPEELFGKSETGKPRVSLEGDYAGGIEKDLVLHRSYRCPQSVLMVAHAIGLGLYNTDGCVQMLEDKSSWEAIGYEIKSGELKKGEKVVVYRPPANSPNRIAEIYRGSQPIMMTKVFSSREEELDWVANSIVDDIRTEGVSPENITVISLDSRKSKPYLSALQRRLVEHSIGSTIPGLINDSAEFAEPGRVTLSTVYRAKGNESHIVYILAFDALYDYVEQAANRNKAFASITRSKAWVRITGVGSKMERAQNEVQRILADQPHFRFVFPDVKAIRRLDAVTHKLRLEKKKTEQSVQSLIEKDPQLLASLDPELLKQLLDRIQEATSED